MNTNTGGGFANLGSSANGPGGSGPNEYSPVSTPQQQLNALNAGAVAMSTLQQSHPGMGGYAYSLNGPHGQPPHSLGAAHSHHQLAGGPLPHQLSHLHSSSHNQSPHGQSHSLVSHSPQASGLSHLHQHSASLYQSDLLSSSPGSGTVGYASISTPPGQIQTSHPHASYVYGNYAPNDTQQSLSGSGSAGNGNGGTAGLNGHVPPPPPSHLHASLHSQGLQSLPSHHPHHPHASHHFGSLQSGLGSLNGLSPINSISGLPSISPINSIGGLNGIQGLSNLNSLNQLNGLSPISQAFVSSGGRTSLGYTNSSTTTTNGPPSSGGSTSGIGSSASSTNGQNGCSTPNSSLHGPLLGPSNTPPSYGGSSTPQLNSMQHMHHGASSPLSHLQSSASNASVQSSGSGSAGATSNAGTTSQNGSLGNGPAGSNNPNAPNHLSHLHSTGSSGQNNVSNNGSGLEMNSAANHSIPSHHPNPNAPYSMHPLAQPMSHHLSDMGSQQLSSLMSVDSPDSPPDSDSQSVHSMGDDCGGPMNSNSNHSGDTCEGSEPPVIYPWMKKVGLAGKPIE